MKTTQTISKAMKETIVATTSIELVRDRARYARNAAAQRRRELSSERCFVSSCFWEQAARDAERELWHRGLDKRGESLPRGAPRRGRSKRKHARRGMNAGYYNY